MKRGPGRKPCVAIVGCTATSAKWNETTEWQARALGDVAAKQGFVVVTGGHTGVMEAAARGAREAGGFVIGITTTEQHRDGNEWCDVILPSGMGIGRNVLTALACDVMVGIPGGLGTLQEMTFALEHGRPCLSWCSWGTVLGAQLVEHVADPGHPGLDLVAQWLRERRDALRKDGVGR